MHGGGHKTGVIVHRERKFGTHEAKNAPARWYGRSTRAPVAQASAADGCALWGVAFGRTARRLAAKFSKNRAAVLQRGGKFSIDTIQLYIPDLADRREDE